MIKRQTERFTVFSVESDEARARRAVFESLAALDYDEARMASRSERKALGKEREGTLTYGEVPYLAMIVILDKVRELRMEIDPHTTGDGPFCEDSSSIWVVEQGGLVSLQLRCTISRRA